MDMCKDVWPSLNVTGVDNSWPLLRTTSTVVSVVWFLIWLWLKNATITCYAREQSFLFELRSADLPELLQDNGWEKRKHFSRVTLCHIGLSEISEEFIIHNSSFSLVL